ncbi:hypothetical protein IGI04_014585 [Brassica rapa subsp. trilocularis]|uniref:Uncharacterized protein n=1 Tax=Brassica rapa subsp. trilocularis TaxID=1813537 RepID=A0ABQ7MML5_BRACM|nr:hypothetical protein IGI04_014585 [Brassica rapa subsp. trilocularis]
MGPTLAQTSVFSTLVMCGAIRERDLRSVTPSYFSSHVSSGRRRGKLTNLIWGDDIDGETGDHRKERSEESKPAEQKITGTKNDLHDSDTGSSSGSWFDLSLSNAREAGQDSNAAELSKCLAEPAS